MKQPQTYLNRAAFVISEKHLKNAFTSFFFRLRRPRRLYAFAVKIKEAYSSKVLRQQQEEATFHEHCILWMGREQLFDALRTLFRARDETIDKELKYQLQKNERKKFPAQTENKRLFDPRNIRNRRMTMEEKEAKQ